VYTSSGVIAHARSQLAGFGTPQYVVIVGALPMNRGGKTFA
jgi:hypothetical protein